MAVMEGRQRANKGKEGKIRLDEYYSKLSPTDLKGETGIKQGDSIVINKEYADLPIGTKANIIKIYKDPKGNKWAKVDLGWKTSEGKQAIKTIPTDVISKGETAGKEDISEVPIPQLPKPTPEIIPKLLLSMAKARPTLPEIFEGKVPVTEQINNLVNIGKQRMEEAKIKSPELLGIKPTETEWLTSEENRQLENLKLQLPPSGKLQFEAKQKIAQKRINKLKKEIPALKDKVTILPRKEQLLTQIEQAIKKAPDIEIDKKTPKVSFQIDGGAKIYNTKQALQEFYDRVKKTPKGMAPPPRR